ncbi:NADP-dependent oxidoreductase [Micromonospora polyrhachis]|uniref:NADPH:quinone reductase-like Zn-dependent oxidoreductase n=1 Tax=Micromonospora polyrhachis TaxID=1282883 RepID=A0A7W7WRK2_9ACTN|nr:NADP-dependent oxidoreductase [Micromonospora polyrhachis]MBB4961009.1 NADPH:quinone reductase-like Zn-dependent oxidoreductase [Micromonospora polyrhachis]
MSRAVIYEAFGGPEVLALRKVPEPHPGVGEVRVHVAAFGLNPMDWKIASTPGLARAFGVSTPAGFGYDFAGVVDEVDDQVEGFVVGDRVFGGALARAAADYVVGTPADLGLTRTPAGVSDQTAATLAIAGLTADATLHAVGLRNGDTILIGGAAGGVGTFAVQLAALAGARVVGTGSADTHGFLRNLGAEPVTYGPGLAARVRALAPDISAATSLVGTETVDVALELGVNPERISTIDAGPAPYRGARATGAIDAAPEASPESPMQFWPAS